MMYKLEKAGVFLLIALLLMTGCRQEHRILFEGELSEADGRKIFLSELTPSGVILLDSAIVSHGHFKLIVEISKEECLSVSKGASFYQIMRSIDNAMTLPAQCGDHISLNADGLKLVKNYVATGSVEVQTMAVLDLQLTHFADSVEQLMKIYLKRVDNDSARLWVEKQYDLLVEHHTAALRQFISQHSSSLTTIMAFYQRYNNRSFFSETQDLELLKTIYHNLSSSYPNNKHVIFIKQRIDYIDEKNRETNNS